MNRISETLQLSGTVIVDVRTPEEFTCGHLDSSINIPLNELDNNLEKLRHMQHIVVCCASGIRSHKAASLLKQNNIDCVDGGSWIDITNYQKN